MKNNQKRAIFILFSCQTAQNIIEVGKRLIQAKSLVNHGHWQDWLQNNFDLTERTARRFMQCAERFSKTVDVDRFQPSQLTELLALPDAEETEKFIAEKATEGQEIGKLVLLAEARLGELFNQMPKAKENQYTKSGISSCEEKANLETEKPKPKMEVAAEMGFNKNQVAQFQKLADNPDAVQKAIDDRTDAKIWILKNQLGRRNLIPAVRIKIALLVEQTIAKVEKIEKQAAPEIKAAVTSSLTTYLAISEENRSS